MDVSNDLANYARRQTEELLSVIKKYEDFSEEQIESLRTHFMAMFLSGAEWQAEHAPLPEDTVLFNKGVEEGKRLMMEEAVEGEVMLNPYPTICLDDCKDYDFKDGDKVRVIIVKKED